MALLFSSKPADAVLRATMQGLLAEVQDWDPDQLLLQSETEIVAYLADRYRVDIPVLHRDDWYMDEPLDVTEKVQGSTGPIAVPATKYVVHVPYTGEKVGFELRPNTFSLNPPQATITDTEVILEYQGRSLAAASIRGDVDRTLHDIATHLDRLRTMGDEHNAALENTARDAIARRRSKLLADGDLAGSVGIPVKRRGGQPAFAVPVQRRQPTIERPKPVAGTYTPEPVLAATDYDEAIRILTNAGRELERQPHTTLALDEEGRRNLLLVALNSAFEGKAGGEVFNGSGKTDILLRVGNRNVFIAECKIWRGPKAFGDAIDQLLGYLVWRDTKAAIVLFIENVDATAVIAKAAAELEAHAQCIRTIPTDSDERRDFVLVTADDTAREIQLALLPMVIRPG